jgi:hypothetical protein
MTEFNDFAARYVAVWNEQDPDLRRKAIARLWGVDARYYNRRTEYTGQKAIERAVTESHDRWVRQGHNFRSCNNAEGHHNGVRFSWDMVPAGGGDAELTGSEFVIFGRDGRIHYDYQFIDKQP